MRTLVWVVAGAAIVATVVRYAVSIAMGQGEDVVSETVFTVTCLAAGGWLAGRPATRRIGLVFVAGGVLGSADPAMWLWRRIGPPFPEIGNDVRFDAWLTYWLWVPQVLMVPLVAMALYPDGRVRQRSAMGIAVAAVVTASVAGATYNWPRSDGGSHGNPLSLPLRDARLLQWATVALVAVALVAVLVSLAARRPAADQATRRLLLIPYAVAAVALVQLSLLRFLPEVAHDLRWTLLLLVVASTAGLARATGARPERRAAGARG
ncbi:hypothetical protein ACWEN6_04400 [Sphaerisporangium sp. NPDC004334]